MSLKYNFILFLFLSGSTYGQLNNLISTQGDVNSKVRFPLRDNFDGGVYLYKNWDNMAFIKTIDSSFKVRGVNYNIKSGNFELKVSKDSVFIINPFDIDFIRVNQNYFKYNLFNNQKFVQIIHKSKTISLYKTYTIVVKKGTYNPLNGDTTPNEFKPKSKYLLVQNGLTTYNFILKKKNILEHLSSFKLKVESYAKANKLKFKKEKDLKKILNFYNSLQKQ